jgi:hypothetical protein
VNNGNNGEGIHPEIPAPNHTRIHVQVGARTNIKDNPQTPYASILGKPTNGESRATSSR